MNLYDVRLEDVKLEEVRATPYEPSVDEGDEDTYDAKFQVVLIKPQAAIKAGGFVAVRVKLQTSVNSGEPFLELSVIGKFQVITAEGVAAVETVEANYEFAALLYPYLRQIAKPILESMGANAIDFPLSPPPAPPRKKPTPRKKKALPSA